jgi:hypothetical protein
VQASKPHPPIHQRQRAHGASRLLLRDMREVWWITRGVPNLA